MLGRAVDAPSGHAHVAEVQRDVDHRTTARLGHYSGEGLPNLVGTGHVATQGAGTGDRRSRSFEPATGPRHKDHLRTGLRQTAGAGQADASAASGHHRHPAVQPEQWKDRLIQWLHRYCPCQQLLPAAGRTGGEASSTPTCGSTRSS